MALAGTHSSEAKHRHNLPGLEMEPTGEAKEGAAKEQLVTYHEKRDEGFIGTNYKQRKMTGGG